MKNKLFIFVGSSASGKTTTENKLIENGFVRRVVSDTSRAKRENEEHGVDYYFKSTKDCLNQENVLTIHITDDWVYSVSVEELVSKAGNTLVYSCINVKPAEDMINYIQVHPELNIEPILVFFNIEKNQRIKLLKARGESNEDIALRLSREDTLENFSIQPHFILTDIFSAYEEILLKGGFDVQRSKKGN